MSDSKIKNLVIERKRLSDTLDNVVYRTNKTLQLHRALVSEINEYTSIEDAMKLLTVEANLLELEHEHEMAVIRLKSVNLEITELAQQEVKRKECQAETTTPPKL